MDRASGPILLIDDSADDAFVAERLMRFANAQSPVVKFHCPLDAVNYLLKLGPAAVCPLVCFVDVHMPKLNGFEIVDQVRSLPGFANAPMVVMSRSGGPEELEQARKAGADCFIKKFPSLQEMQSVLECARVYKRGTGLDSSDFGLSCNLLLASAC